MTALSPHTRGILLAAAGMALISPDGLMLNLVNATDIWTLVFWRSLFMGLAIGAFVVLRYRRDTIAQIRGLGRAGLAAGLLLTVANVGFVGAMLNTSVANVLVIVATMPLFCAVFGLVFLREAVRPRTWVTIAVAFAGIAVLFSGSMGGGRPLGDLIALGIAVSHGAALVLLRAFGNRDNMPVLALAGFLGAAVALVAAEPLATTAHDMVLIAANGLVIVPFALALFLAGIRTVPAAEVAVLSLVETVLGPLWAWAGLGQTPAVHSFIGGAMVLVAVIGNAAVSILRRRSGTG